MAVGRISGPLLSQNLLRNGVDLAFETDLLYLDVNNGQIGIKTSTPQYTLDVNGSARVIGVTQLGNLTVSSSNSGTLINNSLGDVVIQAPTEAKVQIKNDTLISGNLHATGNITANGSVQIGDMTGSDTLSLFADIISDITPKTPDQYNLGNQEQYWAAGYFNNVVANALLGLPNQPLNIGQPPGQDVNVGPITNPTININGPVRIWGDNPLGTGPVVSNVLYVSMDGNDTNDGRAADASRACRTISGAVRSPYYQPGTSIKVAPGHYYENNPIELKPYTSVIGSDLRTTAIEPINKTQDLFHVQSGCYLAQMQFVNGQSGLLPGYGYTPGTNRGAYATAFPPNYGKAKIDVYHSPYIQNCTNQSGPWLQDGTMFQPNQTVQVPQAVGTATWIANTTTIVVYVNEGAIQVGQSINVGPTPPDYFNARTLLLANKAFIQEQIIAYINQTYPTFVYNQAICQRDVGIIVENIAYDAAFGGNQKSVESGLAYWNGVTSVIPGEITQTVAAINYINTLSQAIITNTTATNLLGGLQTAPQVINNNLTNGATAGPIISKLVGIITDIVTNSPTAAPPIQVGNGPDWGSVSAEVLLQTNRSFIQDEVINWIDNTFPGFVYKEDICWRDTGLIIDAISQDIILNANAKTVEAATSYWTGAVNAVSNEVTETVAALNHAKAVALQVISNTTVTTSGFTFNATKCARDIGLIVDALAQDLLFGGNSQSTFAGLQYWNHGSYVGNIAAEITTTTQAIQYIQSLAEKIVVNDTSGVRYQSTISQNTSFLPATSAEVNIINSEFNTITNILINGVAGVTDIIVPNSLTPSANVDVQRAFELLIANEDYLKAEAIAWVDANKVFRYNTTACYRDTGLIVDSIALDLVFPTGSNSQSTFAGLQYWNQNGYTGQIGNELTTTTNTINYISQLAQKVVVNDTSSVRYSTGTQIINLAASGTPTQAGTIATEFNLITGILNSGTTGVTDLIVPNGITSSTNVSVKNAYALLQANKSYIIEEAIAYVAATAPNFTFNADTCARDVGYIVDSVSFDLLYGGNRQAIQSGVYYYNFNSTSTAVPNEIPQVISAYQFIKALCEQLVLNNPVAALQTAVPQVTNLPAANASVYDPLTGEIEKIINIIQNGPGVVSTKEPISLVETNDTNSLNAAAILLANRAFIQAETIAYVNKFLTFQYDPATCARDVGYIIESVGFDLLYGGNRQAVQSGVYYWGYSNNSTSLPKEQVASTLAYQYMKMLMTNIVVGSVVSPTYQNTVTQVVSASTGTTVEASEIAANIDLITEIINVGPSAASAKTPIGLNPINNKFVKNAATLLELNRAFIQAEVCAYVAATQVADTQVFLPFYDKGANATLSVTRNFDIITNVIQNGPHVAPIVSQGNGIFVKTGLSLDDVRVAPVITNISTITSGVYQVDISQSTIGYGDSQTLYFGETAVYPLLDVDVPDRWQQRRINPIGSMGGSLVDGGVVSDRSPITSFVYDAFTQVNQGGRGIHVINNGYAQLVSVFTIFCSQAVTVENGGICSITNSNSNFGDQCLTAKGYGKREFSGYIKNPPVLPYFPNGFYPQSGSIQVYIADPKLRPHIALVMEVEPPAGYTNYQGLPGFLTGNTNISTLTTGSITISGIDTTGMVIGQNFYVVDQYGRNHDANGVPYVTTGTIVSDINYQSIILNYPLLSGGGDPNNSNYFNLYTCGNAYYTVLSSTVQPDPINPGTLLLPGNQNADEVLSLGYLNTLSQAIISNTSATNLYSTATQVFDYSLSGGIGAESFITNELNLIGSILTNGPNSAPTITKSGTLPNGAASAASLLNKNRNFLQQEIVSYVNDVIFNNFTYNTATCYRDTGLIVDAIAQDLLFNTSSQSTFAGLQYWNQSGYTGNIANELTTTTAAINYVSSLAQQVVQGQTGTRYSTGTQITNLPYATSAEATTLAQDFSVITNILSSGTVGVTDLIVPNSINSSTTASIVNAYNILQANRTYIQQEAVAYVNSIAPTLNYNTATCYRDVGYIVDSVSFDLLYGGNRQAIQSGVYYYSFSTTSTAVPNEIPQVIGAYNHISSLTQQIILGQPVAALQTAVTQVITTSTGTLAQALSVQTSINTITNIITNGPSVVSAKTPMSLTRSTNTNVINAAELIEANRAFIQAETIAFINRNYTYNQNKCYRDVGLLVDAVVYDLANGGNYNAVIAGKSYYAQTGTFHLVELEESVTDPALFPDGAIITFYQRSYMSASGYLFEYVGAGSNYGSLPQVGRADPVQTKEVIQLNNGKVFFTSTDQNGDFRIGPGLVISQATGVLSGRTFTKSLFANLTPFILAIEGI